MRNGKSELFRSCAYLLIAIAFAIGLFAVNKNATVGLSENVVAGCERANIVRQELAGFLRDAARARTADGDIEVAAAYDARALRVEDQIVRDCEAAY